MNEDLIQNDAVIFGILMLILGAVFYTCYVRQTTLSGIQHDLNQFSDQSAPFNIIHQQIPKCHVSNRTTHTYFSGAPRIHQRLFKSAARIAQGHYRRLNIRAGLRKSQYRTS